VGGGPTRPGEFARFGAAGPAGDERDAARYGRGVAIRGHITGGPDETERAARALGALVEVGDAIGLVGELGAGKTRFVTGLARGLGLPDGVRVPSPTFTILNHLRGGRVPLYHADLYRIERRAELDQIGLDELWCGDGVVAVEWCDRFPVLPGDHLLVRLRVVGDGERAIDAEPRGARSTALAARWAESLAGG
jgi:tRNA threonylcarbamoyladenosine biosynthesis protein TsaE